VPPGVSAPGPAAEGDAAAGERGVFGVEVHRFEVVHAWLPHPGDPGDPLEVRHLGVSADVVLLFDLNFLGSHDQPSFHFRRGHIDLVGPSLCLPHEQPEKFAT
jgi:hypothetical protein